MTMSTSARTVPLQQQAHLLERRARDLLSRGRLAVPAIGSGRTAERHLALFEFGRESLSLAKIVEAHIDAAGILAEADRSAATGCLYAVWASEPPNGRLTLTKSAGGYRLRGTKRYCTGASLVDRALVTAHLGDALLLCDIPIPTRTRADTSEWSTPAFAATETATLQFQNLPVPTDALVGSDDWYLNRPGFWHGAIGPAACWAGGAAGLRDRADRTVLRANPFAAAHLAAMNAAVWAMQALLLQSATEIDRNADGGAPAKTRALIVRHLIEQHCQQILQDFGRATGPGPLAFDAEVAQRVAELALFVRQSHAESDLVASLPDHG